MGSAQAATVSPLHSLPTQRQGEPIAGAKSAQSSHKPSFLGILQSLPSGREQSVYPEAGNPPVDGTTGVQETDFSIDDLSAGLGPRPVSASGAAGRSSGRVGSGGDDVSGRLAPVQRRRAKSSEDLDEDWVIASAGSKGQRGLGRGRETRRLGAADAPLRRSARQRVSTAVAKEYLDTAKRRQEGRGEGRERGRVEAEEHMMELESPMGEEPHTVVMEIFGGILQSQVKGRGWCGGIAA